MIRRAFLRGALFASLLGAAQRQFSIFLDFWAGWKSPIVGFWAAPGGRVTLLTGEGFAPHLLGGSPDPPGPSRPPKSAIAGRPNKSREI